MKFEDLRAYMMKRHDYTLRLLDTIAKNDTRIEELEEKQAELEEIIENLNEKVAGL